MEPQGIVQHLWKVGEVKGRKEEREMPHTVRSSSPGLSSRYGNLPCHVPPTRSKLYKYHSLLVKLCFSNTVSRDVPSLTTDKL